MEMKSNQNRWQCLFYMIVSLANGNFSYQIRRTSSNDELEALVALTNMLAEELKETFSHHGFIDPRRSYRYIAKMIFILDEQLQIVYFNNEVPGLLHLKEKEIAGRLFKEILEPESQQEWDNLIGKFTKQRIQRHSIQFDFRTSRDLSLSAYCYVSRLSGNAGHSLYSVVSFQPVLLEDSATENSGLPPPENEYSTAAIFSRESDLRLMQEVRDFILDHLSDTIPNIRDLAHHFGTNESKLKEDFRKVFKITPFQFYNRERMNLARELILNTPLPLKSIADMTGFKTYPHFSYAFKKEFGYSPFQCRNPLKS